MSVSVPWPATSVSLKPPSSCTQHPLSIRVHAVNNAGLAGPTAVVAVHNTRPSTKISQTSSTKRPPSSSTLSLTSALFQTTSLDSSLPSLPDNETQEYTAEGELVFSSCTNGSEPCHMKPVTSQLCSISILDGNVSIVSRTETTMAVRLVSSFDIPLHSGLILVRTARYSCRKSVSK